MNIIFTGMRGTGKTTLGKQLAEALGWDFVDIDQLIELKLNTKIDQFVKENGWDAFRKEEKEVAAQCANLDKTIISTGGGTMMNPKSAKHLKKNGTVILLTCAPKQLRDYLEAGYERPSLTGKSALEELEKVWEERKDQYHAVADLIHDTTHWPSINDLIEKLHNHPDLTL